MRTILGIDPSPDKHAWAIINQDLDVIGFGRDFTAECQGPSKNGLLETWIEMIASYGMPVGKEVFDTCVQIGSLMTLIPAWGPVYRVTRNSVKNSVCHSSKAKDSNIRQAVIDRFGGPQCIKKGGKLHGVAGDTWAALAVCLAALDPEVKKYE